MRGYAGTTPTVEAIGKLGLTGNVIPRPWLQWLRFDNGKPNSVAIMILSELCYWYRPIEEVDEKTGRVKGWRKKFKADKLQKSYQDLADSLGFTKRQVTDNVKWLEKRGCITTEFRHFSYGSNILFVDLCVDRISQISFSLPSDHITVEREMGYVETEDGITVERETYTETTSRDYVQINQSNNQSVNDTSKAETFSAARENKSDVLDDLKQLHHGSGNSSSVAQQTDRSHSPQSQSNQTDRSHSSGVGESEKKNTASPRNSLKKEKSVGFKQDEWGIVQLPRAPKYRLASLLATRTMQFLIARDYIECEFAIDRDGDVWILDPKDGDWATEQEVFAGYKDEDGEKVQPSLPLKKLISLVNGSSDEYGPLNIEWYNETAKQWFMFWKSECERLGDEMVSVVQRKSIGVWMQKALDLEFYEYEEVA